MILFFINAALSAINFGMYAWAGRPLSLAVAVFSGFAAVAILAMETRR